MARQPISKKLRFEVFKRDAFTRQYCGARQTLCFSESRSSAPLSQEFGIITCKPHDPRGHASSCDPSRRPIRGPSLGPSQVPSHRDSASVPSGRASSFASTARPSTHRGWRWQSQEAEGSVPRGQFLALP